MLDLEQTLKELGSFVKRLTDDKEENIQQILTRKKGICKEIHKIRKSLNDHHETLNLNNFINSCSKYNTFTIEFALAA
jgi:flagellar biosynthesis chaperone FliJ